MKKSFFSIILMAFIIISGCSRSDTTDKPIEIPRVNIGQSNDDLETSVNINNSDDNNVSSDNNNQNTNDNIINNNIDLSLKPNELGEIMILMYHGIGEEESTWERSTDNFRKDLEYMYKNGYRMISLNDYAKGNIKTKAGYTPIILTFDDGKQNNFNLIEKDGDLTIDKNCAIGILEEFKNKYPDFDVTATFFINPNPFGQSEHIEYKLNWLVDNGYDIGNHTYNHKSLKNLTKSEIQEEIGYVNNMIKKYVPNYTVETLALPNGSNPTDANLPYALEGEYEGQKYKNIAIVDVGWRPEYSPFDKSTDFTALCRVTASEINVDNCGIYDYFKHFESGKHEKYISDGINETVTIPKKHEEYINMEIVKNKKVNIYE